MNLDDFRTVRGSRTAGAPAQLPVRQERASHLPRPIPHRRWLATLPASLDAVREAVLATLTELQAQLAYLYHADDRIVVRSTLGERQIRAEMTVIDEGNTRIAVVTVCNGDVDRMLSSRIVQAVESRVSRDVEA